VMAMRRSARKSAVLFVAAVGVAMSLMQAPSSALEVCAASSWPIWKGIDSSMDRQYKWWAANTSGGCISIIIEP
jgi:hypothetical protein